MKVAEEYSPALSVEESRPYADMPLTELAELIARSDDRAALAEFHNSRALFRLRGGPPMLFAEFLKGLCDTPWATRFAGYNIAVLEEAYDLTVDKFTNIPLATRSRRMKSSGPDCRYYFEHFVNLMRRLTDNSLADSSLKQELAAAQVLQRQVLRHFRLSCLQARRNTNTTRSRYAWCVKGGAIYLWMPASMPGRERRAWLEANVDDPDPSRPGEKARIQAIIDTNLGVPHQMPLEGEEFQTVRHEYGDAQIEPTCDGQVTVHGLATVVADEKAHNIHKQRWAIQALGKAALKRLIVNVFEDLCGDEYEEKRLARKFGLSEPTFSRFAGGRWRASTTARPPDLWVNVAHTLSSHVAFVEAAKQAGVWPQVRNLAGSPTCEGDRP